jgi:hypothetical protein
MRSSDLSRSGFSWIRGSPELGTGDTSRTHDVGRLNKLPAENIWQYLRAKWLFVGVFQLPAELSKQHETPGRGSLPDNRPSAQSEYGNGLK